MGGYRAHFGFGLSNVISLTTYPTVCNDVYQTQCVTDKNVHDDESVRGSNHAFWTCSKTSRGLRWLSCKKKKKSSLQASLKVEEQAP